MADRRKSNNGYRTYNLIQQIELDALRSLTPVNPANSLQLKSHVIDRIQRGFYDQDEVLDQIVQQIQLLYCRK